MLNQEDRKETYKDIHMVQREDKEDIRWHWNRQIFTYRYIQTKRKDRQLKVLNSRIGIPFHLST